MNKTVSINLGGFFFHIDEDAYQKLSRYFEAVKRSLSSEGREEIMKYIIILDFVNKFVDLDVTYPVESFEKLWITEKSRTTNRRFFSSRPTQMAHGNHLNR